MPRLHPHAELQCQEQAGIAIKLFVVTNDSHTPKDVQRNWTTPFVDVFMFRVEQKGRIIEVCPSGKAKKAKFSYAAQDCFPSRTYYFGGLRVLGPASKVVLNRYDAQKCVLSHWNHRFETNTTTRTYAVSCCELSRRLPFTYSDEFIFNGHNYIDLPSKHTSNQDFANATWHTSPGQREAWGKLPESQGDELTSQIPNLDVVEVDNTVSASCPTKSELTVLEWNAERGGHWLDAVDMLKAVDPDVILPNEMDIGMSRTGQQHTARLLAFALRMNYAWALEFVELTHGSKDEQSNTTVGVPNFLGLHGNAILSKCPLLTASILRNPIGKCFFG
jgi:hypothetical protein